MFWVRSVVLPVFLYLVDFWVKDRMAHGNTNFVGLNTTIYVHPVLPERWFSTGVSFVPLTDIHWGTFGDVCRHFALL